MRPGSRPTLDRLDSYLARRDYSAALSALSAEIERHPGSFNLLLRRAEVLVLAGRKDDALEEYEKLARHFIGLGFYARAIAVANKIHRLDPERQDVASALAEEIARRQDSEREASGRLRKATVPAASASPPSSAAEELPPEQVSREREASRFFDAFPRAPLEELLSSTSVRVFRPGEVLVREGDPGTSLFLIGEGSVLVETSDPHGTPVRLATLGPGDFFGEISVLTGLPRTATVTAEQEATVLEIHRDHIERISAEYPEVSDLLRSFYERRAHATVETMVARVRESRG